jgi:hypothetical protein
MSNPPTQPHLSSRNPFRTPLQTPNPTGASSTSSAPSYPTALPFPHTLLAPTPTEIPTVSNAPSYQTDAQPDANSDDEDAPEALPDLTLRIPFRDPPNQPLAPVPPLLPARNNTRSTPSPSPSSAPPALPPRRASSILPPPSSPLPSHVLLDPSPDDIPESAPPAYSLTPDGSEIVVEQGPRRPFQRAPEPFVQPPPRGPYPPLGPPGSFPQRPLSQMSNVATPPPPGASGQQQPRYAPPPGAPPSRPRAASTSSGAGSTAPPASNGHPTTTPTPGHPLLRNGRTLVYPEAYLCPKCKPRFPLYITRSFIYPDSRRQQHGLQEQRPVASVPQVLGPLRQAVLVHTRLEPLGRPWRRRCEPEPARSHVPAPTALVCAPAGQHHPCSSTPGAHTARPSPTATRCPGGPALRCDAPARRRGGHAWSL